MIAAQEEVIVTRLRLEELKCQHDIMISIQLLDAQDPISPMLLCGFKYADSSANGGNEEIVGLIDFDGEWGGSMDDKVDTLHGLIKSSFLRGMMGQGHFTSRVEREHTLPISSTTTTSNFSL